MRNTYVRSTARLAITGRSTTPGSCTMQQDRGKQRRSRQALRGCHRTLERASLTFRSSITPGLDRTPFPSVRDSMPTQPTIRPASRATRRQVLTFPFSIASSTSNRYSHLQVTDGRQRKSSRSQLYEPGCRPGRIAWSGPCRPQSRAAAAAPASRWARPRSSRRRRT